MPVLYNFFIHNILICAFVFCIVLTRVSRLISKVGQVRICKKKNKFQLTIAFIKYNIPVAFTYYLRYTRVCAG